MARKCMGVQCWLLSLTMVATLSWTLALAGSASAMSAPIQISGTDGEGVLIQSEPNGSSTRLGWMGEGASPEYICFTHGEMVGTVSVWFYVTHEGITGYYPSFYDNSSYKDDAELTEKYGVPACGESAPSPPESSPAPAPESSPPPASSPAQAPAALSPPPASSTPTPKALSCYGNYCSGKSAAKTGCATGATVRASISEDGTKLELLWSPTCKTKWARLIIPPGQWDPGEVWAEQSTGYKQVAYMGGVTYHTTTTVSSPMIYSPKKCVAAWFTQGSGFIYNDDNTPCR